MKKWTRAMYQPNLPLYEGHRVTASAEHIALSRKAAEEGLVLLKNEERVLPLKEGAKIALFGKGSFDYVKGGGGSGDVTVSYIHNLYDGFSALGDRVSIYEPLSDYYREYVNERYSQGDVPGMMGEPALPKDLLDGAAGFADTAFVVVSRFSGEGWDRSDVEFDEEYNPWETETTMPRIAGKIFPDGDFYLTKEERQLLADVKTAFDKIVVVLNIGGTMDTSWIKEDRKIAGALLAWQGGMEGADAAARALTGLVNPSGKLPDTFVSDAEAYPSTENFHESPYYVDYTEDIYVGYRYFETVPGTADKVCYPFGYGLSYTDFTIGVKNVREEKGRVYISAEVINTGSCSGKEVVQVYYRAPWGKLEKPARELAAFAKTRELHPGESQTLELDFAVSDMASFDDLGKISEAAFVLEPGIYEIYVGNSVRDAKKIEYSVEIKELTVARQLAHKCVPSSLKKRMLADGNYEDLPLCEPNDPNACVFEKMLPGTEEGLAPQIRGRERYLVTKAYAKDAYTLKDVADGKASVEEFLAQLDDDALIGLLGGQPNLSVANTYGIGNLPEYGVPNLMTADGPAGLRIAPECGVCTTAWPCATMLAATWNEEMTEQVGKAGAEEVKENNISIWLTPAVNIHRNPLCGRNFEYYSEDPFLAGKMASAMVRGIQSMNIAATVKHFACNNKETNRKHSDSRVSERALREIYLKAFEIIVREAHPWAVMSSYNIINGHRASENKELLEDILRGEWGFDGLVVSDWWTRGEHYKEIQAGNDVKMACGFPERVKEAMRLGEISRENLEHCASRVLQLILKID